MKNSKLKRVQLFFFKFAEGKTNEIKIASVFPSVLPTEKFAEQKFKFEGQSASL